MAMAVKRTGQLGFVEALLATKGGGELDRLGGLVKWYRFEKLIGLLRSETSPGRPGYPVLVLFKAVLLASLYGLSERELEATLNDRLSFRRLVGLSLEEAVPDHTVLNRSASGWRPRGWRNGCSPNWTGNWRRPVWC